MAIRKLGHHLITDETLTDKMNAPKKDTHAHSG